ncbi:uncharacterized protein MYCGRDRAFT_98083 [Zymoseptoria tritici IPO323]|uniref:Uncharacterized protein n=1 Tax=Zymoseptoria tritici (strain CBS 115943 / IPO323) TaxID=336722 RepID=F9XS93_ZYMTI|nr:uncharacterized protein MYCGRDRAFT_98083 [Zymoseptoria tritici IPO323]EGP81830.1 hypothetical protein MYCGRDRAFT_98083 [Zymoseptoria tritici IPO323]
MAQSLIQAKLLKRLELHGTGSDGYMDNKQIIREGLDLLVLETALEYRAALFDFAEITIEGAAEWSLNEQNKKELEEAKSALAVDQYDVSNLYTSRGPSTARAGRLRLLTTRDHLSTLPWITQRQCSDSHTSTEYKPLGIQEKRLEIQLKKLKMELEDEKRRPVQRNQQYPCGNTRPCQELQYQMPEEGQTQKRKASAHDRQRESNRPKHIKAEPGTGAPAATTSSSIDLTTPPPAETAEMTIRSLVLSLLGPALPPSLSPAADRIMLLTSLEAVPIIVALPFKYCGLTSFSSSFVFKADVSFQRPKAKFPIARVLLRLHHAGSLQGSLSISSPLARP